MMERIRTRAMLYAMGIVTVLIAFFLNSMIEQKHRVLDEKISTHRNLLRNAFEIAVLNTEKGLQEYNSKILSNSTIIDDFENGNRQALYQSVLPLFNQYKENGLLDLCGFIQFDGHHFLRMSDPLRFGDNITNKRPILSYALNQKISFTSLDATIYNVAMVHIAPVFNDGRFIGILQSSASIERIQDQLNAHSDIKSAIAFDTKTLQRLLPGKNLVNYGGFSVISQNDPLFSFLPKEYNFPDTQTYKIGDKTYVIATRSLENYRGEVIAKMICALDITADEVAYKNEIKTLLIVSFFVLLLLGTILYLGFGILIRRINRDSLKTQQLYEELEKQFYTDHLTSLPNRHALMRELHSKRHFAVILLNIDDFKELNDFYGHEMGDKILLAVTENIRKAIIEYPMDLYKMPSDEFALILNEMLEPQTIRQICDDLIQKLHTHVLEIDEIHIYLTMTMGIDIGSNVSHEDQLARADMALKSAKKRHISSLMYDETFHIKEEYHNNILWTRKLTDAIEEKRFKLYFQTIYDSEGNIFEREALIRMIEHDGTVISPYYFLQVAKKSKLYHNLSRIVIEQIFNTLESHEGFFSLNLSIDDILDQEIQNFILSKLSSNPHAHRIVFELLESEGIENYTEVSQFIALVKSYGAKIAIDDFGTGYSNFAHILQLNVDILKIDGSLIKSLDTDTNAQTIVKAITLFSKRLGLQTVAEFVHNEAVYEKALALGVDYFQGYYLSEPQSID